MAASPDYGENSTGRKNLLFVLSGPSGVGKSSVIRRLMNHPVISTTLEFSISATTREPRPGEEDHVHYHFMEKARFEELVGQGGFLEWAHVHGHMYGTPASNMREAFSRNKDLLLEIDVEGARQIKESCPEAVSIFITAPLDEIRGRLASRPSNEKGEKHEKTVSLRMQNALEEIAKIPEYDYIVKNETLDECVELIICIIRAERSRVSVCAGRPDNEEVK